MTAAAVLVAGLGVLLLISLLSRALRGRFDPFDPVVLFSLAYGVVFVARPAAMLAREDFAFGGVDLRDTFPLVTLLALVGGVAFLVGYETRAGTHLARALPEPRPITSRAAAIGSLTLVVLAAAAFAGIVLHAGGLSGLHVYAEGRSGTAAAAELTGLGSYVWYASRLVVPASLCLFAVALRDRSPRFGLAAAACFLVALLVIVPMGSRIFLLPLLGGILVFLYVRRGARPSAFLLIALAALALFASYAAVVIREPERRAEAGTQFEQLAVRPYRVFDLILYRGDAEMAPVLAGALTAVPDRLGHRYGGATLGEFVVRPIPRQLWPTKPATSGERVVRAVWPDLAGSFHPAFTPLLSFYWDFGIAGVAAGMALFGVGSRLLYEWFRRHAASFSAQLIFAVALWYVAIGVRGEPVETAIFASFVVLPLVLLERASGGTIARPFVARMRPSRRLSQRK